MECDAYKKRLAGAKRLSKSQNPVIHRRSLHLSKNHHRRDMRGWNWYLVNRLSTVTLVKSW